MTDEEGRIVQLSSAIVHEDRWMRVRHDRTRRASGALGTYTVVEKADFSAIAAIQDGMIHLVRQFRYPVGGRYWELPQGSYEGPDAITAEQLAANELREETGMLAASMAPVGSFFLAYGYSNQRCHVFLASGLTHVGQSLDEEEEGLETAAFPLDSVAEMIGAGEIVDATTIAAFGLLLLHRLV